MKVPNLSPSLAKAILRDGPEEAYKWATRPFETDDKRSLSKRFGDQVDNLVFNQGKTLRIKSKRGEKERRDEILLTAKQAHEAQDAANAVIAKLPEGYLNWGLSQKKLVWNEDGMQCSAKPDWFCQSYQVIDLKSIWDITEFGQQQAISNYGYDLQMYVYGHVTASNICDIYWIESRKPYEVRIKRMTKEELATGKKKWQLAKLLWRQYLDGNWQPLEQPKAATAKVAELDWADMDKEQNGN